ncbi:MAG: glycosyltransferase family 2 protein [Deltaproteobacteria bacterium]|nr:glycosyltransferase family 2 protein [Deltaproteobacteria bacterium]
MRFLTVAICTYNRGGRLPKLVMALRQQECPISFEILVVDNNSTDNTQVVLDKLAKMDGPAVRFVKEAKQGIVHARNRAIEESGNSTYLAFIDDDELPGSNWLNAAIDALERERAECVGGEIRVSLPFEERPFWLEGELLPFLGEVKNGPDPFWITDSSTPVWSGNVAYQTSIFSNGLRFDYRYNRQGHVIGGGSDEIMFHTLLDGGVRIRYRPDMLIEHLVERWRLKRSYFLKLHYKTGWRSGRWAHTEYGRTICGIPPFMMNQALRQWRKALPMVLRAERGGTRQAMNSAHALGLIIGRFRRWRESGKYST